MTHAKKVLRSCILALGLLVVGVPAALAQETTQPVPETQPVPDTEPLDTDTPAVQPRSQATTDDGFDWGWLGLIGLIGLAGLAGRNRNELPPRDRVRP